jgi:hypothetical protein
MLADAMKRMVAREIGWRLRPFCVSFAMPRTRPGSHGYHAPKAESAVEPDYKEAATKSKGGTSPQSPGVDPGAPRNPLTNSVLLCVRSRGDAHLCGADDEST